MPICNVCKKELPESKFSKSKRTLKSGEEKSYTDTTCMVCRRKHHLSKEGKREIHRLGNKEWIKNNEDKVREQRLRKYGITSKEYNDFRHKQNYRCAICNEHESMVVQGRAVKHEWSLNVDHCHKTGIVRGLLCINCNNLIGKAKENIRILNSAIDYLNSRSQTSSCD